MRTTTSITLITGLVLGLFVFPAAAQDSLNMRLLGSVHFEQGYIQDIAIDGHYAYVAADYGGLRIIDFSNVNNCVAMPYAHYPQFALGVALSGDYAYVAANCHGFQIVDISDPAALDSVSWCDPIGSSFHTVKDPNRPYVYTVPEFFQYLSVLDVSNPANPIIVQEFCYGDGTSYHNDIGILNNRIYMDDEGYLRVIDVSDPTQPDSLSSVPVPGGYTNALDIKNGRIAVASNIGLALFTPAIELTGDPVMEFFDSTAFEPLDVVLSEDGRTAFVAAGFSGIQVFDVSESAHLQMVGCYTTGRDMRTIAVKDSFIFANDGFCVNVYCYTAPLPNYSSIPTASASDFRLLPVYPNPFNATTTIRYTANGLTPVNLVVFDISGRLVQTLQAGNHIKGEQRIQYNASHLPSGTYLLRMESGGFAATQKMILLK